MERDGKIDMLVDYFVNSMDINELMSIACEVVRKNVEDMGPAEIDAQYEAYFGEVD